MALPSYKKCAVPFCGNTSKQTPEKLFIHVPHSINQRRKWLQLARREYSWMLPRTMYFCEDHFDLMNDMENYMEYKIMGDVGNNRMKPDCLPSRFACQDNFIVTKTTQPEIRYERKRPNILRKQKKKICSSISLETVNSEVQPSKSELTFYSYLKRNKVTRGFRKNKRTCEDSSADISVCNQNVIEDDLPESFTIPENFLNDIKIDPDEISEEVPSLAIDLNDPLLLQYIKKEPSTDETQHDDENLPGTPAEFIKVEETTDISSLFTNAELRDMICIYAQEDFSETKASEKYSQLYPDRKQPSDELFKILHGRLGQTGAFNVET